MTSSNYPAARAVSAMLALCLGLCGMAQAAPSADIAVAQVAPLSGVLASTGQQMVLGE